MEPTKTPKRTQRLVRFPRPKFAMDLSTTATCIHKILLQAALVRDLGRLEWLQILHFLDENFQPPRHGTHATWRHLSPTLPALAIRMNKRRLHPQCKNAPTNWRGCIGLAPLLYMTTGSQELAPPLCGQYAQKKPSIVTCPQTASPIRLRGTQTLQMNEICSRLLFSGLDHGQRVCPPGPRGNELGSGRIPETQSSQ